MQIEQQPEQQQTDSTSIDGMFYLIGFLSCLALTVFDYYTSFTGIRAFATPEASDVWKTYLPAVMSGVAITFVACSTVIVEKFLKEQSPKTLMLMVCFLVSVIYDLVSSFLGTVAGMMGMKSSMEAIHKAPQELLIFSAIAACLMMLGSFLLSKWFFLLKNCPGWIGDLFRSFGA